jgi:hypothetical protein
MIKMKQEKDCRNGYIKENLTKDGYIKSGKGRWRLNVKLDKVLEASGMMGSAIHIIGKDTQGNFIEANIFPKENGRRSKKMTELQKVIKVKKEYPQPDLTKHLEYDPESLKGIWLKGEADKREILIHDPKRYYSEYGFEFSKDPTPIIDKKNICSKRR